MKEASIESDILQYLNYMGGYFWRTHDAKHKPCTPGVPDIVGVKDGRLYAVEVKKPGGKTTPAQDKFIGALEHNFAIVKVASSIHDVQGIFD